MTQPVHGGYTAAELDAQYDTAAPVGGDAAPYLARCERESAQTRAALAFETLRYGPGERECFDVVAPARPGAPLFVFVHGGYWRRMSKDAFSFAAGPVARAGGAVALLNYPLAPAAGLDAIVAAVRAGYAAALDAAAARGADTARVVLGGHSVGAQLAAAVAATADVPALLCLSGLYDLEPLRHTRVNDAIRMDAATAARNAPLLLPPRRAGLLAIACGQREQAEFHRQQRDYVRAWRAWGGAVRELPAAGLDHFSIVLALGDAASPLARALLGMLALDAA